MAIAEVIADSEKQAAVCAQNNLLLSLPDDVLFKILYNLSAQDIYRASLVCRRLYYDTIRSEEFVNLHLRQNEEYGLFLQVIYAPTRELIGNDEYSSQRTVFVSMKQGRVTISDYYAYKSRFKSSCNGLIAEYNSWVPSSGVLVANPVTRRASQLPPLPENANFMHCCVGYAQASKAYKVALVYSDGGWNGHVRWAMLTVGLDRSWRHIATDHWTMSSLRHLVVTEGFIHFIFRGTIVTLNVETEGMTKTRAPVPFPVYPPNFMERWYLSAGKSLTVLVKVEDGVFRVLEMVCGDYYHWREWEHQIVLGSEIQYPSSSIYPVGWLQQMEVLVFKGWSKNSRAFDVFYVVIATGEIGRITPISSDKEGLVEEFYEIIDPVPHRNTLVELEGYY